MDAAFIMPVISSTLMSMPTAPTKTPFCWMGITIEYIHTIAPPTGYSYGSDMYGRPVSFTA